MFFKKAFKSMHLSFYLMGLALIMSALPAISAAAVTDTQANASEKLAVLDQQMQKYIAAHEELIDLLNWVRDEQRVQMVRTAMKDPDIRPLQEQIFDIQSKLNARPHETNLTANERSVLKNKLSRLKTRYDSRIYDKPDVAAYVEKRQTLQDALNKNERKREALAKEMAEIRRQLEVDKGSQEPSDYEQVSARLEQLRFDIPQAQQQIALARTYVQSVAKNDAIKSLEQQINPMRRKLESALGAHPRVEKAAAQADRQKQAWQDMQNNLEQLEAQTQAAAEAGDREQAGELLDKFELMKQQSIRLQMDLRAAKQRLADVRAAARGSDAALRSLHLQLLEKMHELDVELSKHPDVRMAQYRYEALKQEQRDLLMRKRELEQQVTNAPATTHVKDEVLDGMEDNPDA